MSKEKPELKVKKVTFDSSIPREEKQRTLFKIFNLLLSAHEQDTKNLNKNENANNKPSTI